MLVPVWSGPPALGGWLVGLAVLDRAPPTVPHFCQDGRDVLQFLSKAGACCESLGPLSAGRFIELQSVHRARRREVRFYPSSPDGGGVASRFL